MAIKNPNPNIKDFEVNDNTTWSSAHIAAGLNAAGVNVGSYGSVTPKQATLLLDSTLTEAKSSIDIPGGNFTKVIAVITATFGETVTNTLQIKATSPENSTAFPTGAYSSRSYTGGSEFKSTLYASCENGLLVGYGAVTTTNGTGNLNIANTADYTGNIITSKFSTLQIVSSNALPIGTNIKVYGY